MFINFALNSGFSSKKRNLLLDILDKRVSTMLLFIITIIAVCYVEGVLSLVEHTLNKFFNEG